MLYKFMFYELVLTYIRD